MNTIRLYLLSLPTIRTVARIIGLQKTYVYHMIDREERWNPYLSTLAQFAFAYKMTISELIVKAYKTFDLLPSDEIYERSLGFEALKDISGIYSNENIERAFNYFIEKNHITRTALQEVDKVRYDHFFENDRVDIYTRTIDDICHIAKVTPYEFISTIEAIAYKDVMENSHLD